MGDLQYERDVLLSVQLNRWILKPIGVWPRSSEVSRPEKYLQRLVNVVCYCLIGFLLIPCGLYTVLEVEDLKHKIKLTGPMSFYVMAIAKYYSLIFREDDIRRCIQCIQADWRNTVHFEDRRIMIKNANFGRRLVTICAFFMYGGAVFFYLAAPISAGRVVVAAENLTFMPLVYPVPRIIADTRRSPVNEIFFSVQCLTGFIGHSITAGACSLAAVFAMHVCGQLQVLMSWIKHLVDGREDLSDDVDVRFAVVIEQHNRVLSFLSMMENILRQISLVEISGCTLNMCFLGYYVIMEWESNETARFITYLILLVSLTFNIFIFCYIGDLVAEQCKKVGDALYMTEWYRLPKGRSLSLILAISMSNSTMKLTAGNLIELSLSSFSDVVKTSVAYLNMLRTMTS